MVQVSLLAAVVEEGWTSDSLGLMIDCRESSEVDLPVEAVRRKFFEWR